MRWSLGSGCKSWPRQGQAWHANLHACVVEGLVLAANRAASTQKLWRAQVFQGPSNCVRAKWKSARHLRRPLSIGKNAEWVVARAQECHVYTWVLMHTKGEGGYGHGNYVCSRK